MQKIITCKLAIIDKLNIVGSFLPQLTIRLLLAYEFWTAGIAKFKGENWFYNIQSDFPFPFNLVPTGLSWFLATWTEILGAIALAIGLATRFTAFSLIILDLVAWYSVHAGHGYNVCDNGFKLPLMYLILFLPLFFSGAGKVSIDYWIRKRIDARM
jgi:putative oxidoreductase